jgi:hypothetical protein
VWRTAVRALASSGALLAASGCAQFTQGHHVEKDTKPYVPPNHAGDPVLPKGIRRVVVLPVAGGSVAGPESAYALDAVVVTALQKQNRFEVVSLTREECRDHFHVESIPSSGALPTNLMSVLQSEYRADAVMFIDVTVYKAYEPLVIGFRAKLAKIDDARLIWTFDSVFSADDPSVARSAAIFIGAGGPTELPNELESVVLESPSRFASYAATTMFRTLPPVVLPPPAKDAKPDKAKHPDSSER